MGISVIVEHSVQRGGHIHTHRYYQCVKEERDRGGEQGEENTNGRGQGTWVLYGAIGGLYVSIGIP